MKNLTSFLVATFAVIAVVAGAANAGDLAYVGVQLTGENQGGGTPLGSSVTAGLIPQDNFNVASGQSGGPLTHLVNASGAATSISLSWTANDSWVTGTTANGPNGVGDPTLLSGEDKTGGGTTATYTLSGVPAGKFDLIAYTVADNNSIGQSTLVTGTTPGSSTLYNVDQSGSQWNGTGGGVYLNGGSSTQSNSATPGNYVEFTNVSPVGGVISFEHTGLSGTTSSYNGFQLTLVTPEPGSFVLCGLGAVGLDMAAWRRRRKA